jgi:hypothetical protein
MAVVSRSTLKGYFDTGDTLTSASMNDFIDSGANLYDTTAQAFQSEISSPLIIAANISAASMTITGALNASAATFGGRIRQGVSAAASAADSRGDFVVVQEATVTNTTAQVAFLPSTSNVVGLGVKVLVGGSAAAGGFNILAGDSNDHRRFGKISVSAVGMYLFSTVSARVLTGVSGRIEMICSGASANSNAIGFVQYYQRA